MHHKSFRRSKYRNHRPPGKIESMLVRFMTFTDSLSNNSVSAISKWNISGDIQICIKEIEVKVFQPQVARKIWILIELLGNWYVFCPDKRIGTLRLFGKPALGPSPPLMIISNAELKC